MATRIKMIKLLQETRGFSEVTNRRVNGRSPGLFVLQLRSHRWQSQRPKPKLLISIDMHGLPEIPHPVKIRHVAPVPGEPRTAAGDSAPQQPAQA